MKIMQILNNVCHWNASQVIPNLAYAAEHYPSNILFVEAPDHVFEGWGYNETLEGDARFIKPEAPEGWVYDDETGTFYNPDLMPNQESGMDFLYSILDTI